MTGFACTSVSLEPVLITVEIQCLKPHKARTLHIWSCSYTYDTLYNIIFIFMTLHVWSCSDRSTYSPITVTVTVGLNESPATPQTKNKNKKYAHAPKERCVWISWHYIISKHLLCSCFHPLILHNSPKIVQHISNKTEKSTHFPWLLSVGLFCPLSCPREAFHGTQLILFSSMNQNIRMISDDQTCQCHCPLIQANAVIDLCILF